MSEHEEIVLVDEEGVEHHFHLHSIVEVDGRDYALLEPRGGDGELVVLRVEGEIESGSLVTLDDDEWERVAEALEEQDYLVIEEEDDEEEAGERIYGLDDEDDYDGEYDDEDDEDTEDVEAEYEGDDEDEED